MPRLTKAQKERAHLCSHPGCDRLWTSTFSGKKLCPVHEPGALAPTQSVPTTAPVKSWADPERSDE